MTKRDFLNRIGKGPMQYKDFGKVEFFTQPSLSFPEEVYVHGILLSESPFADDAQFGGCFLSHVTDEDCENLDAYFSTVRETIQKAERLSTGPASTLTWIDRDSREIHYLADVAGKHLNYEEYKNGDNDWFYLYVLYKGENDYAFSRPVILDGVLFRPIHSFWLGHSYYDRKHPNGIEWGKQ